MEMYNFGTIGHEQKLKRKKTTANSLYLDFLDGWYGKQTRELKQKHSLNIDVCFILCSRFITSSRSPK